MKISPDHLKRYKMIATLLWKYGHSDLVRQLAAEDGFATKDLETGGNRARPEQLAADLEAMGPTYVKIGQVLAGRSDLLPRPYVKALARLQDNVKPFPYAEVEKIVALELETRLSKAFARFDPEPIAAASLGQVHYAELRDGRPVIVKVQRPDIRRQVADDFEVLAEIAEFLDQHTELGRRYRFSTTLGEFRETFQEELNYEQEARNLTTIGSNLREFERIVVPAPILDYTTRSILTMDYIDGRKVTALGPLAKLEVKGEPLAEELFQAYLKQVLIDGLFHADPHPGNVFITPDGRIALLDLGMVGHVAPAMQEHLLKVVMSLTDGQGDQAAEEVIRMSERSEIFNAHEFRRQIAHLVATRVHQRLQDLNIGQALMDVSRHARENGLFVPSELTLLAKTLFQLDQVGRILAPDFDPNASVRRNASRITASRIRRQFSQGSMVNALLEVKDFVSRFPTRLNRILDAVANAELEVKVRATDAKTVVDGIEKVANRITNGLLLAALIIGAALMMRIDTRWRIFGYPGFAMCCFLFAAIGAVILLYNIWSQDRKRKKNRLP